MTDNKEPETEKLKEFFNQDVEEVKKPTTDVVKETKSKLLMLLITESPHMIDKYKKLIGHLGSLLQTSMVYAYSKGYNDAIKLITKENN